MVLKSNVIEDISKKGLINIINELGKNGDLNIIIWEGMWGRPPAHKLIEHFLQTLHHRHMKRGSVRLKTVTPLASKAFRPCIYTDNNRWR